MSNIGFTDTISSWNREFFVKTNFDEENQTYNIQVILSENDKRNLPIRSIPGYLKGLKEKRSSRDKIKCILNGYVSYRITPVMTALAEWYQDKCIGIILSGRNSSAGFQDEKITNVLPDGVRGCYAIKKNNTRTWLIFSSCHSERAPMISLASIGATRNLLYAIIIRVDA